MRYLLLSAAVLAAPCAAATADQLYAQGQFVPAATAARAGGDFTLAAKATLIAAAFQATEKAQALAMLAQAQRDADTVLARNAGDTDARLQHALVVGYRAKLTRSPGDAKAARKEMEAVVAAAPGNALAKAALGGWHGDAIIDAGPMLAGMALGAKKADALRNFDAAIAQDPANAVFPTYYAIMLLKLDKTAAAKATALLQTAAGLRPRDGFEAVMKARATQILAPLRAGNVDQARALAVQLAPFGKITAKV